MAEEDCTKALQIDSLNIKALYRRAMARKVFHGLPRLAYSVKDHVLAQEMKRYAESMKDLKLLLERDAENSAAQSEYTQVKKLWEKELRQLQASNLQQQKQERKQTPSSRKKAQKGKPAPKSAAKDKDKLQQQRELEKLLAETRTKMQELKEVQEAFKGTEYLTPEKTTQYKNLVQTASQAASTVHRKVQEHNGQQRQGEERREKGRGKEERGRREKGDGGGKDGRKVKNSGRGRGDGAKREGGVGKQVRAKARENRKGSTAEEDGKEEVKIAAKARGDGKGSAAEEEEVMVATNQERKKEVKVVNEKEVTNELPPAQDSEREGVDLSAPAEDAHKDHHLQTVSV